MGTTYEYTSNGVLVPANFAERKPARPEMREIATTLDGRDITRGYIDPMQLQQTTDTILRLRGSGDYEIYKQVLRDDQVKTAFGQRTLAVTSKDWHVDAGGTSRLDKKAADSIREQIDNVGFDRLTEKMLYGLFYGYAVAEAMWANDGNEVVMDRIIVRNRERFGFDGAGRLRMKTFSSPDGELLPDRKFWCYTTGGDHDDEPYGIGLAHWLYWPTFFKRNGLKYWLVFLEKFGQPTAVGKYPNNALPNEKNKLLQALGAIATDAGVIVPEGMQIELLEAARSGTADYTSLYDRMDKAIAKVVLGQSASTEGTPGKLGSEDLQGDVREDIVKADSDLICESFNRTIVKWLTEWNYPGAELPKVYRKVDPEEDQNTTAERDKKIYDIGFKPTLKHITDTYGGEWVERAAQTPEPINPQQNALQNPAFAERAPTTIADQLDDRLQRVTDDWLDKIKALVENAQSVDEIRDGLLALMPDMTIDQYAAVMAEALRVAELSGRDDVMMEITNAT